MRSVIGPIIRMNLLRNQQPTMIRRLRRKFVMTAMGALLIVLILLLGFINLLYLWEVNSNAGMMLTILLDNNGVFPVEEFMPAPPESDAATSEGDLRQEGNPAADEETWQRGDAAGAEDDTWQEGDPVTRDAAWEWRPGPFANYEDVYRVEAPFETRYFSALVHDGTADTVDAEHIAAITEEQANSYAVQVVSEGRSAGYLASYKFGTVTHDDGTVLVVFVDCSSRFSAAIQLMQISLLIGGMAVILMFVIVYILSGIAVAPAAESIHKQRTFISDAGHELKTPLSVISANVDVLEMDGDRNEWTQSIRNQVRRMTDLVNNMLTLSRMEEGGARQFYSDVDLSQCMEESTRTFRVVAMARERQYEVDLSPDIHLTGDRKSLMQLSAILLDNAMKYSNAGGTIRVRLYRDDKRIHYDVRNTCDEMPEGDLDRLFDRFYRADSSRSRERGGYGIGLSVAKAICENHGGTITAQREEGNSICFAVSLPPGHKI